MRGSRDVLKEIDRMGLDVASISGNEAYLFCPFHADSKKPSMAVSLRGEGWWCFSCEIGGSLARLEKMLEELDEIPQPIEREDSGTEVQYVRLARMDVEDFLELPLAINNAYLLRYRFLTNDTIESWQIRQSNLFVIIPIFKRSKISGLVLRAVLDEYSPKYQLQPKGFSRKTHLLCNPNIRLDDPRPLIVVEGPLDAIKVWQNGFQKVCAIFGSSMSDEQAAMIKKMSGRVMLLFDNEVSGFVATQKNAKKLADIDLFVPDRNRYISKDPGDMDKEELEELMEHPVSYLKARMLGIV